MARLLVIDDDEAMLRLFRLRLGHSYEIVQSSDPKAALALALEHRPDAIVLDLMMPQLNGIELFKSLRSLSYTSSIPILVLSGAPRGGWQENCAELGVKAFFEKPVDFQALKEALDCAVQGKRAERRKSARVRMRVPIVLRGIDIKGNEFVEATCTDDVSSGGFLSACNVPLAQGMIVRVFLGIEGSEHYAGAARVAREQSCPEAVKKYGFEFTTKTFQWILHPH
jgi:CheY-like chemotaxis protein